MKTHNTYLALAGHDLLECLTRMILRFLAAGFCFVLTFALLPCPVRADSDPAHVMSNSEKSQPWPGGVVPYDISKLTPAQQGIALRGMQRWMDTGANIKFVPRAKQKEYVNFTGNTNAGNNTSH